MKKFLIVGSSLAAVAAAGSAGAVDVTLGGSIDMGIEFGLGKDHGNLLLGSAYNEISLSLAAAGTTDGGLRFGGGLTLGTTAEIKFNPYKSTAASGAVNKYLAQKTNNDRTDILGHAYNVSGGAKLDNADIVSVKINSNWVGVDSDAVQNIYKIETSFTSSAICKIAGRGQWGPNAIYAGSATMLGDKGKFAPAGTGYLPAGQLMQVNQTVVAAGASNGEVKVVAAKSDVMNTTKGVFAQITQDVTLAAGQHTIKAASKSGVNDTVYAFAQKGNAFGVTSAAIYVGPFMEVVMASSSTKMVVGALCLDGNEASETAFYMDNATDLLTIFGASVFIEGGFGRLTIQYDGEYTGAVKAVAGAGNLIDLYTTNRDGVDSLPSGLVIALEGVGPFGMNPYVATWLGDLNDVGWVEPIGLDAQEWALLTGGTIEVGAVQAAFDLVIGPTSIWGNDPSNVGILFPLYDLGLSYETEDFQLSAAFDSVGDWGLSAAMDVVGFQIETTLGNGDYLLYSDHEKKGIHYSVSATTSLNGYNLAIGFDQALQPAIGIGYDLGGLNIYANYDAAEKGGSVGATLSF